LFIGPVFTREATITPRRSRLYILRTVYAVAIFVLMCTAWLVVAGTQMIQTTGDMARFGSILFQIITPLQLTLILFLSAVYSASSVAQEKDKKTFILLLLTQLTNRELVLGRLFASLLQVIVLVAVSAPVLMLIVLFGGVAFTQVGWALAVTTVSAFAAGSLGSVVALWREKTFQTLALTTMLLVSWIGGWEALAFVGSLSDLPVLQWLASICSPSRAILNTTNPMVASGFPGELIGFCLVGLGLTAALNAIAIAFVRIWNPGREVRMHQVEQATEATIWSDIPTATGTEPEGEITKEASETQREAHVDARVRQVDTQSREVWDNPILWREMKTWAYGRKILFIRMAYWILAASVTLATWFMVDPASLLGDDPGTVLPPLAKILGPFMLLSLVLINALSVTSITNERDGRSLDLLLVTDLSPKEFLFGKLFGILYVTVDMVVWPVALSGLVWLWGGMTGAHLFYLVIGLLIMYGFVAMLGIHCGASYTNSRQAVAVSLGTVFFLFLGIMTCMYMMISFGSFQGQLTPFLAFIVGGGVGLYVAWGRHNPSPAIFLASGVLPLAMFFVITSFLIGRMLSVFLVMGATYGFATTALMMPALGEYMLAMGRSRTQEEE
jgi:ABC-type Na+ efflux pump permease subunit